MVKLVGKLTTPIFEQLLKAYGYIVVSEVAFCKFADIKYEQPLNAYVSIWVNDVANVPSIRANVVHPLNAYGYISVHAFVPPVL